MRIFEMTFSSPFPTCQFDLFYVITQLKSRVLQYRGTWEDVYKSAKRADRSKNDLHERDEGELLRTGQPLCIYEPYFGEGTWSFLHQDPLYRGVGLVSFHVQYSVFATIRWSKGEKLFSTDLNVSYCSQLKDVDLGWMMSMHHHVFRFSTIRTIAMLLVTLELFLQSQTRLIGYTRIHGLGFSPGERLPGR